MQIIANQTQNAPVSTYAKVHDFAAMLQRKRGVDIRSIDHESFNTYKGLLEKGGLSSFKGNALAGIIELENKGVAIDKKEKDILENQKQFLLVCAFSARALAEEARANSGLDEAASRKYAALTLKTILSQPVQFRYKSNSDGYKDFGEYMEGNKLLPAAEFETLAGSVGKEQMRQFQGYFSVGISDFISSAYDELQEEITKCTKIPVVVPNELHIIKYAYEAINAVRTAFEKLTKQLA